MDDSEESETPFHSRLNLKRKATYNRSSKAELSQEPPPYKKRIEHAGYRRCILHYNPPRYDPDGDIVEPIDEYEDEEDLSQVEEDPYADIHLETLLAPLTSAADLPNHPSMSLAYTSKHLTHLTEEAGAISRKEQIMLAKAKRLCTKLQGDVAWVPFGLMAPGEQVLHPWKDGINLQDQTATGMRTPPSKSPKQIAHPDAPMTDEPHTQETSEAVLELGKEPAPAANGLTPHTNGDGSKEPALNGAIATETSNPQEAADTVVNGDSHKGNGEVDPPNENDVAMPSPPAEDVSETASQHTVHRMTTRAQAHAISKTPSPPPSPSSMLNPIHPLFTFPTEFLPDRDFGLPAVEAEETRMMLLALVQKQEEIARAASDLYLGMMQGDRMRGNVYKWAKAEGHVGEMSDGEDWYDREEWGLNEDLAKGRDEEEEDNQPQGKKTTRRQGRRTDKDDR